MTRLPLIFLLGLVPLLAVEKPGPDIVPGTVVTLDFPELGEMHDHQPAACEVGIPATYAPGTPAPLFVWFGGGRGSNAVAGLSAMVDTERFVVVALPYPNGHLPRLAAKEGKVDSYWDFHRVMLDRVKTLVPNIDPNLRLVAGTSSGGHYIAYGLDRAWSGFADYFTTFIIHEGGAQPLTNDLPNAKGKHMLVVYGEESTSIVYRGWLNWNLHRSGADATFIGVPKAGHGLNNDARQVIREWIEKVVAQRPDNTASP